MPGVSCYKIMLKAQILLCKIMQSAFSFHLSALSLIIHKLPKLRPDGHLLGFGGFNAADDLGIHVKAF